MELRERVNAAVKQAMKDKAAERLSTLRLINAAIKDRDIAVRAEGNDAGVAERRTHADLVARGGRAGQGAARVLNLREARPAPTRCRRVTGSRRRPGPARPDRRCGSAARNGS